MGLKAGGSFGGEKKGKTSRIDRASFPILGPIDKAAGGTIHTPRGSLGSKE